MIVEQRYDSRVIKNDFTEARTRVELTAITLVSHMKWMSEILIRAGHESGIHLTTARRANPLLSEGEFVASPYVTCYSEIGLIPVRKAAGWKSIFVP